MCNEIPSNEVTVETYSNEVFTDSVSNKASKQTYSNSNISESKKQCERCNKERDELETATSVHQTIIFLGIYVRIVKEVYGHIFVELN
jgi:hypothetical protein